MRSFSLLLLSLAPLGVLSQRVSRDATCGGSKGYTCQGSTFGNCCSQYGWCGSTDDYCGKGCNSKFGRCNAVTKPSSSSVKLSSSSRASSVIVASPSAQPISNNARCGPSFGGRTCLGSRWGDCCSQHGYCGSTNDYCAASTCQKGYGKCNTVSSARSSAKTSMRSSTSSQASSVNPSPVSSATSHSGSSQRSSMISSPAPSGGSSAASSSKPVSSSASSIASVVPSSASPPAVPESRSSSAAGSTPSVAVSSAIPSSQVPIVDAVSQSSSNSPASSVQPSVASSSLPVSSINEAPQSDSPVQSPAASPLSDPPSSSAVSPTISMVPSSSVNNDSPPFTPTASVVLPSDPEEFLATYTFEDDPLPTPIAMGTPPSEDGAGGAELTLPKKCLIVPGQGDATFQLLNSKDRIPLTQRADGTLGSIPAPKSEAEFLAMPSIDDLKITSFSLISTSNGLFDLVTNDSPRKYVAKKADNSVVLTDQSTNDAQMTTSIFDITCEGRITVRIGPQYYNWALTDDATAMETAADTPDTMYTLPDNPVTVKRRQSKSQQGIAPRCNAYPRDLEARVFPGARRPNPNKCGSSSFKVPDLSFGSCCDQHDNDFDDCSMTFEEANDRFRSCMRGSGCAQFDKWYLYLALVACRKTADFYYSVVSNIPGMLAFYSANKDRCKCYCPSYAPHGCTVNGQFQCLNVFSTDTNNCGACGRVCPQGSRCENGQCKCPAQQCGDRCVSLSSHPKNCGSCGRVSPSGYCVQGQFYSPPAFCSRGNGFRNGNFANGGNYWNAQIVSGGGNSRFDVGFDGGAQDADGSVGIFSLYAPNGGANLKTTVKMCPGTPYNLQFQIRRPYGTDNCNFFVYLAGELKSSGPVPQPTNIGAGWVWVSNMRAGPFFGERQGVSAAGPELWADFQLDIRCSGSAPYNFIRVDQFSINPA